MTPRLNISFTLSNQKVFWFGKLYTPQGGEFLLDHARSGIVMALRAAMPIGSKVGVVAYNCHTVSNAVEQGGCKPVYVDVTEDLHIDLQHLAKLNIDALVVTNLFGIRNDISAIRAIMGDKPIIVDNAHGYGLPAEGDFTVYSINQGKFPAIGEGGILRVNNEQYQAPIQQQYDAAPGYGFVQTMKLYATMLIKAFLHRPWLYGMITRRLKALRTETVCREIITPQQMVKGVRRMYQQALPTIDGQIAQHQADAQQIANSLTDKGLAARVWWGENAFMAIARCNDPLRLSQQLAAMGVDSATHFAKAIDWAKQFGYQQGQCPMAERLTNELIMIPTYVPLAQFKGERI